MNQDERAALERLLEYVGRGFCAVQSDCKMLREFLTKCKALDALTDQFIEASAQTVEAMKAVVRKTDMPDGGSRLLVQAKGPPWDKPTVTYDSPLPATAPIREEALLNIGSSNIERLRRIPVGDSLTTDTHRFTKMIEGYVLVEALAIKPAIHAVRVGKLPPTTKNPAPKPRKQAPKRKR